jgi:hypothetical protein
VNGVERAQQCPQHKVCENDSKIWAFQAKNQTCMVTSIWEMLQYSRSGLMLEALQGKGAYRCG